MRHALFLAWRSLAWYRGRSLTIVLSLAIMMWLPVTVRLVLDQFRTEISSRAVATPLIVGARGSRIDLVLHGLYFDNMPPATIPMQAANELTESDLGTAIPLYARYRTQSQPGFSGAMIVGTSPEYFEFRRLTIESGEMMSLLGECVVGWSVAQRMGLKAGDSLLSAPENAFDLAGNYPLKMQITGVLARSLSADDDAVFTDVRTVWVIDGIGHGHQELNSQTDPGLLLPSQKTKDGASESIVANASVLPFTEITEDNVESFHFHGEPDTFPLTAVLVVPNDEKSRVRILGRYSSKDSLVQCLKPPEVIDELLSIVFRIEQLVWGCSVAAAVVTVLLLTLIVNLTLRLRAAEMQTLFRIGCSRGTIAVVQTAEILIMFLAAALTAAIASWLTVRFCSDSIRTLLF
jgi:putative ABC transport system permease protein